MRFLLIDDMIEMSVSVQVCIQDHIPDAEFEMIGFADVGNLADVSGFDYAFTDLAHRRRDDRSADEYPGVTAAARLTSLRGAKARPFIVVLTGESGSFYEDVVRQRIREAGCECFVHRQDLHDHFDAIVSATGPSRLAHLAAPAAYQYQQARIGKAAQVNRFVTEFPGSALFRRKLHGRALSTELERVGRIIDIEHLDDHGNLRETVQRKVGRGWLHRAYRRATRLMPDES